MRHGNVSERTAMSSTCCRLLIGIQLILLITVLGVAKLQISTRATVATVAGFQHKKGSQKGESNEFLPVFHI
jgi:hypothetical protein